MSRSGRVDVARRSRRGGYAIPSTQVAATAIQEVFLSGSPVYRWFINKFTSVKAFVELVITLIVPIVATLKTMQFGREVDQVAGKSRGQAFFDEAQAPDAIRDRLGFMAKVRQELEQLFAFIHTLKDHKDKDKRVNLVIASIRVGLDDAR